MIEPDADPLDTDGEDADLFLRDDDAHEEKRPSGPRLPPCHDPFVLAVALGLSSSLFWGLGDFLGGLQSRRVRVFAVLLVSQASGLVAIAIGMAIARPDAPALVDLWPAAAAGLA